MLFEAIYRAATSHNGDRVQVKRPDGKSRTYAWDYAYEGVAAYRELLNEAIKDYLVDSEMTDIPWCVFLNTTTTGAVAIAQVGTSPDFTIVQA